MGMALALSVAPCWFSSSVLRAQTQQQTVVNNKVTLQLKNASVKTFFSEMKRQTGLDFMCSADLAKHLRPITLNVKNADMSQVLNEVLGDQNCQWTRKGDIVMLTRQTKKFTGNRLLKGTVKDEDGEPVIGAFVKVDGTNVQTVTDANGYYQVRVPADRCLVTYGYLGMESSSYHLAAGEGNASHHVVMVSCNELKDVMVTGYQTISRERATGSYSIIGKEELERRHSSNLADALDGLVPGMQSQDDGRGGKKFTIRGTSTMNANKTPLVVVDGYPIMDNNDVDYKLSSNPNLTALERINPDDVESITVLKDAAAASIWGARSANGVIVITTKKGKKKNAVEVEAGTQFTIGAKQNVQHLTNLSTSRQTINYQKWIFQNGYLGEEYTPILDNINNCISPSEALLYQGMYWGTISEEEMNAQLEKLAQLDNRKQISKYMLQTPVISKTHASVSANIGGWDTRASLQYEHEEGDFIGRHDNTWKADWQNSYRFNKMFTVNLGLNLVNSNRHSSQISYSDLANIAPYEMLLNEDGSYATNWSPSYNSHLLGTLYDWSGFSYHNMNYNLLQEARNRRNRINNTQMRTQVGLQVNIIDGVQFNSKFQYETSRYTSTNYYGEESFYVRNMVNYYTPVGDDLQPTGSSVLPMGAISSAGKGKNHSALFRNDFSLDRVFGEKHAISAVLGNEISNYYYQSWTLPTLYGITATSAGTQGQTGYFDTYDQYQSAISGVPTEGKEHLTDTWNHNRYVSFYGNASYMYDERYGVSVSARSDASNMVTSEAKYRWSPLWSVGAMWNINNEAWLKDSRAINRLSLRATYGKNGNAPTMSSARTTINTENGLIDDFTGLYPGSVSDYGNPTLRWEKTAILNLGVDFSLLDNHLFGSVDYYNKKSTDVLGQVSIANVNGTSYATFNNAAIRNNGIEVNLGTQGSVGDFGWGANLSWAYNKNEVTKLFIEANNVSDFMNSNYIPGYPISSIFTFEYGGMENGMPTIVDNEGNKTPISDMSVYSDAPEKWMHYQGTSIAPHTVSLNLSVSWKDLSLSAFLNGRFGGKMRMPKFDYTMLDYYGMRTNLSAPLGDLMDSDGKVVAAPSHAMPLPTVDGDGNPLSVFDYMYWSFYYTALNTSVESSDYIYLSEIDLNYSLPKSLFQGNKWVKSVEVFGKLENVGLLWTANSKHYNPMYLPGNWEPQLTFTLGANVKF